MSDLARPAALASGGAGGRLLALIETLRPKQWTKNLIIFTALVFDVKLLQAPSLARATAAFAIFCLLSGSIYLINDRLDVEKDRAHPAKRHRPVATGRLPAGWAGAAVFVLWLVALPASLVLGPRFLAVALGYLAVMLSYQWVLKNHVLLDVFTLAGGFVLRAVAGAVAIGVPISPWLYVVTVLLSLFLGFSKRRHELLLLEEGANHHRPALEHYSPELLDQMIMVVAASTIMAYSLYTFTAPNLPQSHAMMATIPFVIYGLFRYFLLIHRQADGGAPPDQLLLTDKPLLVSVVLWGLTVVAILYTS